MKFNMPQDGIVGDKIHLIKEQFRLSAAIKADEEAIANGESMRAKDRPFNTPDLRRARRLQLVAELAEVEEALKALK